MVGKNLSALFFIMLEIGMIALVWWAGATARPSASGP